MVNQYQHLFLFFLAGQYGTSLPAVQHLVSLASLYGTAFSASAAILP
jgi:hypothetical protein